MAESMVGLKRSHRCTEVSNANIGEEITVMGWVQKSRNKGGIIFVDLRDRSGVLQVIFEEDKCGSESFAKAEKLRSEFVVAITGEVVMRAGDLHRDAVHPLVRLYARHVARGSDCRLYILGDDDDARELEGVSKVYRIALPGEHSTPPATEFGGGEWRRVLHHAALDDAPVAGGGGCVRLP